MAVITPEMWKEVFANIGKDHKPLEPCPEHADCNLRWHSSGHWQHVSTLPGKPFEWLVQPHHIRNRSD